jgi:hypothetical protein
VKNEILGDILKALIFIAVIAMLIIVITSVCKQLAHERQNICIIHENASPIAKLVHVSTGAFKTSSTTYYLRYPGTTKLSDEYCSVLVCVSEYEYLQFVKSLESKRTMKPFVSCNWLWL